MSLFDTASLIITPNGYKAGKLYSIVPSDGSGDMTVTRATTATRVNSAGLIESVASNVPRLDYSNGTCPSILVEPQRTNLLIYSEQLDNASWLTSNATVTANTSVSPDGNTTADTITSNANGGGDVYRSMTVSGVHTLSAYFKAGTTDKCRLGSTIGGEATFNLTNQTYTIFNAISASITNVGNGWYRCTLTVNITATTLIYLSSADISTKTVYAWGAQLEAGSYATSYIPTTSASVTRNADVISKTGISSLIGQTEGTMFVDIDFNNIDQTAGVDNLLILNNGTNNNEIVILLDTPAGANKTLLGLITNGGSFQSILYAPSPITATRYKIALAYKNNDVAFYINGSLIGTDTSATIPTTSAINFKSRSDNSWLNIQQEYINTSALWKTRLTNTQLAQLTTI